jgi:hypothetical protein
MKSLASSIIFLLISVTVTAQNEIKPLPKFSLNVNLAGFLLLGPIIQPEFQLGKSNSYLAPYARLPYAGLFYQISTSEKFENIVSPVALGLGFQYKKLIPKEFGTWYWGGGGDYSFGSTKDRDRLWEGKHAYAWVMLNGGMRWRDIKKRTFVGLGLSVGPYMAIQDNWWYYANTLDKHDNKQNFLFAMVEFSIGFER